MSTNTHTSSARKPKTSIRTKLIVSAAITIGLAVLVALTVFLQYGSAGQAIRTARFAREAIKDVSDLNSLGYTYLLLKGERPRVQWELKHGALEKVLSGHVVETPQEKALIVKLSSNLEQMKGLFDVLVKGAEEDRAGAKNAASSYDELNEGVAAQLMARSEIMINDAAMLGRESAQRVDAVQRRSFYLVFASAFMLIVSAFVTAFFLVKSIGGSIRVLKQGTQRIAAGDFEYRLGMPVNDELGELGRSFDDMSEQLQRVTVSKGRLEQEVEERRRVEEALRESEQRWATTLTSIGDAVIATDTAGRITFMNGVAEVSTGWTLSDALQKPIGEVFHIINEHTGGEVESPVTKVLREGMVVGLANHTILIRKDGTEIPIDDSGAPIRDKDGGTMGVVLVFRDITDRKQAEDRLRESEIRMSRAEEIANLGGWELDVVNNSLSWSDQVYRIFGLQPQEFRATYDAFLEAVHPDDRAAVDAAYSGSLREERDSYEIEHRVIRKSDGQVRTVHEKCEHIRDKAGKIVRSVGMVHDITERKQMEEELRKSHDSLELRVQERTEQLVNSEKEFRLLAEAMPQIVWITGADGLNIYFNQQWVDYTGLTLEESYGHGWNKPFHADDRQRAWDAWQNAVTGNGAYSLECRLRKADGTYRWWLVRGVPVIDKKGEISKWFGTCTDIEEIKRKEEAVQLVNAYNRSLIEASLDPLVAVDLEGHISDVNTATEQVTGCSRNDLIGTYFWDYFTEPEMARSGYKRAFREGLVRDYALEIRRKDGHVTPVLYNASVYRDEAGKVIGIFTAARDITERRQAEEALRQSQKMEAIGTLAGGIAHDFNNILAAILGFTEMAVDDVPDRPLVERNLKNVLKSAMRARDLVKQILAFSRKSNYERSPLSLTPLMKETIQLLRASIPTTVKIKFTNTASSDAVLAAPVEVQVLMNLATNASLAMEDKGGILEISLTDIDFEPESPVLEADVAPGEYIQLIVKDTGVGMSHDVMKRVFEPFFTTRGVSPLPRLYR